MLEQHLHFTVCATGDDHRDTRIDIKQHDEHVSLIFNEGNGKGLPLMVFNIDKQQLGELGGLFLALAGDDCDHSSIDCLLEGFGANEKELKSFASLMRSFAQNMAGKPTE